jgi:hypothetical protein
VGNNNQLFAEKKPGHYYEIINGPEAWVSRQSVGDKWIQNCNDYWDISNNLDQLIY